MTTTNKENFGSTSYSLESGLRKTAIKGSWGTKGYKPKKKTLSYNELNRRRTQRDTALSNLKPLDLMLIPIYLHSLFSIARKNLGDEKT